MSLPSLQAVLDTGSPVVACARPWARDLLAGFHLDGFVEMKGHWREDRAAVSGYKKQARHVRAKGLLLPDSLSSAMVFTFAGVPSAGYRDDGRSLILRWPINKPDAQLHAVQSWRHLACTALSRWNLPAPPELSAKRLGLKLTQKHYVQALKTLDDAGLKAGQFILIAPTATGLHHGKAKVWPHFDQLTRSLQNRGRTVVMCPPPSEITQAKQNAPTALVLAPVDLGAFATLTRLASLVICNDSGVSHLAAAAGAKQLTLFGVTERERTGPWSNNATCLGSAHSWPTLAEVEKHVFTLLH